MALTRCINQPLTTNYLTYTETISNSSITINYETEQITVNHLSRKLRKAHIIVIKGNHNRVNVVQRPVYGRVIYIRKIQVEKVSLASTYEPEVDYGITSFVVLKGQGNHYRIRH